MHACTVSHMLYTVPMQSRERIILELARFAHPSWYHSILSWDTESLRALLDYYSSMQKRQLSGSGTPETTENECTCEECDGTGFVAYDAEDGEGHTMRGAGGMRVCICQKYPDEEM